MTEDWGIKSLIRTGAILLAVLVFGFGGWGVLAQISGAIIVPAYIDAGDNRHSLQHMIGGTVQNVHVSDGEHVMQGQILLTLDASRIETERAILEGQQIALLARRARLQAVQSQSDLTFPATVEQRAMENPEFNALLRSERDLFTADQALLAQSLAQLENQGTQINIQQDGILNERRAVQDRFNLVTDALEDQQTLLAKGLVAAERVSRLAQQSAALKGDLARLETAYADTGARAAQLGMEAIRIRSDRHQKAVAQLGDTETRLAGLDEQLRKLNLDIERQTIRAPIDGVVHALQYSVPGGVLRPGQTFVDILPIDGQFRAIANLSPAHIDHVFVGQQVELQMSDLGIRNPVQVVGTVALVSADAFVDQGTGQRYFRVEIELPELASVPDGDKVLPGMSVEAFFQTGSQRPLAYLTAPFLDYFRHAFRER